MGAPIGNQNAAKAKKWAAAVERALERRATGDATPDDVSSLVRGLDMAADAFVSKMMGEQEIAFFKEFGDRIDGKAAQALDLGSDPDRPIVQKVVREIVRPENPDG